MLAIALLFVGITLITNGVLFLQKCDVKSIAFLNIITAIVLILGNFIGLARAETMMDYTNAGSGFLFGFTYAFIAGNLLLNLDGRVYGWYSLMVAIYAVIMGFSALSAGLMNFVFLWFTWSVLWGAGFVENVLKKPLGKFMSYLCIGEGIFAAFIPSILLFFEIW
ncbi:MAG: AmiS/UreI family transporter [Clostridia bacterium]